MIALPHKNYMGSCGCWKYESWLYFSQWDCKVTGVAVSNSHTSNQPIKLLGATATMAMCSCWQVGNCWQITKNCKIRRRYCFISENYQSAESIYSEYFYSINIFKGIIDDFVLRMDMIVSDKKLSKPIRGMTIIWIPLEPSALSTISLAY